MNCMPSDFGGKFPSFPFESCLSVDDHMLGNDSNPVIFEAKNPQDLFYIPNANLSPCSVNCCFVTGAGLSPVLGIGQIRETV